MNTIKSNLLFFVLQLLSSLPHSSSLVHQGATKKVCRGTQRGLSHEEGQDVYRRMRLTYSNCTYVDGNLELVFITDPSIDLSFLQDIREVTGYVLIFATYHDTIPLHNLRVIRGRTLFRQQHQYYSLYISNNYDTERPTQVGLKELGFTSLHEIQSGSVFIWQNNALCHEDKVLWKDIVTGEGSQVVIQAFKPEDPHRTCGDCDAACDVEGTRYCWGDGSTKCQKLNKMLCSRQCDGQCFGSLPSECCDGECIGGCQGPSKTQCWACKNFDDNGSCEKFCPAESIYDEKLFKQVPNPAFKYSYGPLCVDKCPEFMISKQGACVHDCGAGMLPNQARKCVLCDGACPKTCKVDEITTNNIADLQGCTVISGNIEMLAHTFAGDRFRNIPPMNFSQLNVLKSVKEITGYLKIQVNHTTFRNLSFLSNLKNIHGQLTDRMGAALHIFGTRLDGLGLDSLKHITNGGVYVVSNPKLCYADTINWGMLIHNVTKNRFVVQSNKPSSECAAAREVCHTECTTDGCWGPLASQCLKCKSFSFSGPTGFIRCVSSCTSEAGMYRFSFDECQSCHPQCLSNCSGPDANQCDKCRVAKDGPFCVAKCPSSKYLDHNGHCSDCHNYCDELGCTGPLPDQTDNGCVSCKLPLLALPSSTQGTCLPADSNCPQNYFRRHTKAACIKCHSLCSTCIGPNEKDCLTCKHVRLSNQCLERCPDNHFIIGADDDVAATVDDDDSKEQKGQTGLPKRTERSPEIEEVCQACDARCFGCHGASNLNCTACKQYKVYLDDQNFYCAEACPDEKPVAMVNNTETVCTGIDYKERLRVILCSSSVGLVVVAVITSIIVTLCLKRKKAKEKLMKAKQNMKEISSTKEMINLTPSGMDPDLTSLIVVKKSELNMGPTIGSGAYGTVKKGYWRRPGHLAEEVAIKILNGSSEGLLSEARIMASVDDKNCIRILCVCLTRSLMLITPLMNMGCMLDYIRKQPQRLSSSVVLLWSRQIAEGMHHLETKGIVHCDLAARNVLVESLKQVKITDFGLAKLVKGNNDLNASDTVSSTIKLPVKWLAYESLTERVFNHKSDVWSYGVTIWELCTLGDKPYRGIVNFKTLPSFLEQGNRLKRPFMCTQRFYSVLLQCWHIDPDERPSFEELAGFVEEMQQQPSTYIQASNDNSKNIPVFRSASGKNHPNEVNYLPVSSDDPSYFLNDSEYINEPLKYVNQSFFPTEVKPYVPCDIQQPEYVPEIEGTEKYYNHFSPGFLNKPLNYQHYKSPTNNAANTNNNNNSATNNNHFQFENNDNSQNYIPNTFPASSPTTSIVTDARHSTHSNGSAHVDDHDYYNTLSFS